MKKLLDAVAVSSSMPPYSPSTSAIYNKDALVRFLTEHKLERYGQTIIDCGIVSIVNLLEVSDRWLIERCFMAKTDITKLRKALSVYSKLQKKTETVPDKPKSPILDIARLVDMAKNDALDKQIRLTRSAILEVDDSLKLKDKQMQKPPFRFLHSCILTLIHTSGFGKGLFDDRPELTDAQLCSRDRELKTAFFSLAFRFFDEYTGDIFGLGSEAIILGQSVILTNQWLEAFATAAREYAVEKSASAVEQAKASWRLGSMRSKGSSNGESVTSGNWVDTFAPTPPRTENPSRTNSSPRQKVEAKQIGHKESAAERTLIELRKLKSEGNLALALKKKSADRDAVERRIREAADRLELEMSLIADLELKSWQLEQNIEEMEGVVENERWITGEVAAALENKTELERSGACMADTNSEERASIKEVESQANIVDSVTDGFDQESMLAADQDRGKQTSLDQRSDMGSRNLNLAVALGSGDYTWRYFDVERDNTEEISELYFEYFKAHTLSHSSPSPTRVSPPSNDILSASRMATEEKSIITTDIEENQQTGVSEERDTADWKDMNLKSYWAYLGERDAGFRKRDEDQHTRACSHSSKIDDSSVRCKKTIPTANSSRAILKQVLQMILKDSRIHNIICLAPTTNEVCGSSLVDLRDEFVSLWPVSVNSKVSSIDTQKELIQLTLKAAEDAGKEVICMNLPSADVASFPLYASLGFRCADTLFYIQGFVEKGARHESFNRFNVSMMDSRRDAKKCADLYQEAFPGAVSRYDGIIRVDSPMAKWTIYDSQTGSLMGFSTGFHSQGFTLTRDEESFKALLFHTTGLVRQIFGEELEFRLPNGGGIYGDILSWCLSSANLRILRQENTMVKEVSPEKYIGIPRSARPLQNTSNDSSAWQFVYCPGVSY